MMEIVKTDRRRQSAKIIEIRKMEHTRKDK